MTRPGGLLQPLGCLSLGEAYPPVALKGTTAWMISSQTFIFLRGDTALAAKPVLKTICIRFPVATLNSAQLRDRMREKHR